MKGVYILQFLMVCVSILTIILYNKSKPKITFIANIISALNQGLWIVYATLIEQYGLYPISAIYLSLALYNIHKYVVRYIAVDRVVKLDGDYYISIYDIDNPISKDMTIYLMVRGLSSGITYKLENRLLPYKSDNYIDIRMVELADHLKVSLSVCQDMIENKTFNELIKLVKEYE